MTLIHIVAGLLIAVVVGLLYYISDLLAESAKLMHKNATQADLLLHNGLEIEHLRKRLEKINDISKV